MKRWIDLGQWLVIAGMFLAGVLVWPLAPERMPVHWNLSGTVDRYGGKWEGLFLLPVIALLVALLFEVLPKIDPHGERYVEFRTPLALLRLGVVLVLAGVYAVALLSTFGVAVNVGLVIGGLVGALFVLIGFIIGQVPPNWFVGIRTPWTLSSETAWAETHRQGRWVFVVMGLAFLLYGIAQTPWALYLALAVCLAGVLGLVGYSYVVWRRTA